MPDAIPGERPTTVEEVKRDHEHVPDFRELSTVLALEGGRAVGMAQVTVDEAPS